MVAPESLEEIPFFRSLGAEEREQIASITETRTYKAGETIFAEGASMDSLRVLEKGMISFRQKQKEGGEDSAMGHIETRGDVFGIAAVVGDDNIYPHSAVCLEDSEVLEIDGPKLRALCESDPALGAGVFHFLAVTMSLRLSAAREQLRSRIRPGLISHG
jgi:CRP-like cAMP-binding protein